MHRKKQLIKIITYLFLLLVCLSSLVIGYPSTKAAGGYIYVSGQNGNDSNSGTQQSPKKTIKAGIEAVAQMSSGGEVRVALGVYPIDQTLQISSKVAVYGGYSIDFTSRNIQAYPTIIDDQRTSGDTNNAVTFGTGADHDTIIDGFTIEGSRGGTNTAGIYVSQGAAPFISNNIIKGGQGVNYSYGIRLDEDASPLITNNQINGGSANGVYGIYCPRDNEPKITYNNINAGLAQDNTAHGIFTRWSTAWIEGNLINGGYCQGADCYSCGIREGFGENTGRNGCSHSTIINNVILGGTGYRSYGILTSNGSDSLVSNNTIKAGGKIGHTVTAIGIYLKNDEHTKIINNIIFATNSNSRYCIYENDPGDYGCDGDDVYDSNPGILRNNNLFDCPNGYTHTVNEPSGLGRGAWGNITSLNTNITTDQDGLGTMAEWSNISEDISDYLDSELKFTGNLNNFSFDTRGINGASSSYHLNYTKDKDRRNRSPLDNNNPTGWSMGAYEYDNTEQRPELTIIKTSDKSTVSYGQKITYTIKCENNSLYSARNTTIGDVIPSGTSFVFGSDNPRGNLLGSQISWDLGNIEPGSNQELSFSVIVN